MVREVADQHSAVDATIHQVRQLLDAWRQNPNAVTRDALADSLENLTAVLSAHLDDEERLVVPLAAVTLTQEERNAVGEHARGSVPQEQIFLVFGMLLEPLDDDDRAFMLAPFPPPVREVLTTTAGGRRTSGRSRHDGAFRGAASPRPTRHCRGRRGR